MKYSPVSILLLGASACSANPWADSVVQYDAGTDGAVGFDDPTAALGAPTRFTSPASQFGGPVTPFNPPFGQDEIVSIGEGGSLTVAFDEPVTDDPLNPYGIDLLVFGNAFLGLDFDAGVATGGIAAEGGEIEVSTDGVVFVPVPGVDADGAFPTLGFSDITEPFPSDAMVPADFTRPVDPSLTIADLTDLTTAEIVAVYGGSGGGAGIDIGALGLSEVSFVRITNPMGAGLSPEIDAVVDVRAIPEPAGALVALAGLLYGAAWRRH